jgi:5'-deoxynucleotidase YfbR-like HD superfamily hydrolase
MSASELLRLFQEVNKLKTTARAGWLRCGVDHPESVADHSFRTAIISMIISDNLQLDTKKVLKMALLHDLAEAVVGDITPYDNLPVEEKLKKEEIAVYGLLREVPNRDRYLELWQDYASGQSAEAKLVKNVDKLEMALQAYEYQKAHPELDLAEFLEDAEDCIDVPGVQILFEEIAQRMKKLPKQVKF